MRTLAIAVLSSLVLTAGAGASGPAPLELTFGTVFARAPLWGKIPSKIDWATDGSRFTYVLPTQEPAQPLAVFLYDVAIHRSHQLFGSNQRASIGDWSPDSRCVLVTIRHNLYVLTVADRRLVRLADDAGDAQWSPDGSTIGFIHDADIWVTSAGGGRARAVTRGGKENVVQNGELDWVYPEELGTPHGYTWSHDGKSIAYLRMDERKVTNFPITDFLTTDNVVHYERYPLAGEANPRVSLREVTLDGRSDRLLYDAAPRDEYIAAIGWGKDSPALTAEILDRHQRTERFVTFDGSSMRELDRESSPSWVDVQPLPRNVSDGRSVWLLGRTGTAGVFVRSAAGRFREISGSYRVFSIEGVDARRGVAYAEAAYPTRRDRSLLALRLGGGTPRNLTPAAGTHRVRLAPTNMRFVDTHSTLNDPYATDLVTTSSLATTSLARENDALQTAMLPTKMLSVSSKYGALDATMLLPPNFDPSKRYPVVVYVYGGPDAPTTQNAFGDQRGLYHQLLARAGFIVFSLDGPASQVDNDAHVRLLRDNFGPGSLMGQEIGARYLATLPYVDASRIGIWGWSFGGYETVYAMTHSKLFKAGAAVAPVTDWHFYDTIYTERYMGLPRENPKAYDVSSTLFAARDLHGPLLIQHGTSDDNVHMANTIAVLQRFIVAQKSDVWFYAYPRKVHSIAGLAQRRTLYERMFDFWEAHL